MCDTFLVELGQGLAGMSKVTPGSHLESFQMVLALWKIAWNERSRHVISRIWLWICSYIAILSRSNWTIFSSAICTEEIAYSAICTEEIADSALCAEEIADSAICAEEIADSAIYAEEIADSAICAEEKADSAIWAEEKADSAICAEEIAD